MIRETSATLISVAMLFTAVGCGEEEEPAGPDVTGYTLPEAKKVLKKAGVNPMVESDTMFGVIIESNFTVCEVNAVNTKSVRLTVDNDGCQ